MTETQAVANSPAFFRFLDGRDELIAGVMDSGAADNLVKPFSPAELTVRIRTALRQWALAEPAEPCVRDALLVCYVARCVTLAGRPLQLITSSTDCSPSCRPTPAGC